MALDARLVAPKERTLFVIGVVFSSLAWLVLIVTVVGLLYALLFGIAFLAAHALFLAHVRNNAVRVSERQLPELHARILSAAGRLGLKELPEVYVLNGSGLLNAFATKFLSRRYVVLLSDLVDHCQDPRQLDFVVGHELGHLAAGHLNWLLFLLPYRMVPWLGAAYSRACEYTCDRCGRVAAGDLEQSLRGLVVLAAGGRIAAQVDLAAYAQQRHESGGFWATVLELASSHPFLAKRVAELHALETGARVEPVRRSALGWVLAPALGSMTGAGAASAPLVMVAIIGMLAAIAIPNFVKYQLRTKEALAKPSLEALYQAEVQTREASGEFRDLRLGDAPGTQPVVFGAEELAAAKELGFDPPAGYHVYTVATGSTGDGQPAFAACAESDLDGDGVYAAWMVWEPVEVDGQLMAPDAPCRFDPMLARPATFGEGDRPGVATRVSPEGVF